MSNTLLKIINKYLGSGGRLIAFSKSGYRKANQDHIVYFNAQIFNKKLKFMWAGDLDITKDKEVLEKIATEAKEMFYVIPEPFNPVTKKDFEKEWSIKILENKLPSTLGTYYEDQSRKPKENKK